MVLRKTSRSRQGEHSLEEATRPVERPRSNPAWPEAGAGKRVCLLRPPPRSRLRVLAACLRRAFASFGPMGAHPERRGCGWPTVTSRKGVGGGAGRKQLWRLEA